LESPSPALYPPFSPGNPPSFFKRKRERNQLEPDRSWFPTEILTERVCLLAARDQETMSAAASLAPTSVLADGELDHRLDSPRDVYNSPSSISDVDSSADQVAHDAEVRDWWHVKCCEYGGLTIFVVASPSRYRAPTLRAPPAPVPPQVTPAASRMVCVATRGRPTRLILMALLHRL
jgi:hypothetical protein